MNLPPCWIDVKCQCGACFTARIASDWALSVSINHVVGVCCQHPDEWVQTIVPDSVFGLVSTGFVQCPICSRRAAISLQGAPLEAPLEDEKPEPISFDQVEYADYMKYCRLPNFKGSISEGFVNREAPSETVESPKEKKLPRRRIHVP